MIFELAYVSTVQDLDYTVKSYTIGLLCECMIPLMLLRPSTKHCCIDW